jgi:hypothetical protein
MNLYQPHLVTIETVVDETPDTRTLRLRFKDPSVAASFAYRAGQFGEYSVFGAGECTFCIASAPTRRGYIECSFKAVGRVTRAMRELDVGGPVVAAVACALHRLQLGEAGLPIAQDVLGDAELLRQFADREESAGILVGRHQRVSPWRSGRA